MTGQKCPKNFPAAKFVMISITSINRHGCPFLKLCGLVMMTMTEIHGLPSCTNVLFCEQTMRDGKWLENA